MRAPARRETHSPEGSAAAKPVQKKTGRFSQPRPLLASARCLRLAPVTPSGLTQRSRLEALSRCSQTPYAAGIEVPIGPIGDLSSGADGRRRLPTRIFRARKIPRHCRALALRNFRAACLHVKYGARVR